LLVRILKRELALLVRILKRELALFIRILKRELALFGRFCTEAFEPSCTSGTSGQFEFLFLVNGCLFLPVLFMVWKAVADKNECNYRRGQYGLIGLTIINVGTIIACAVLLLVMVNKKIRHQGISSLSLIICIRSSSLWLHIRPLSDGSNSSPLGKLRSFLLELTVATSRENLLVAERQYSAITSHLGLCILF